MSFSQIGVTDTKQSHKSVHKLDFLLNQKVTLNILNVKSIINEKLPDI